MNQLNILQLLLPNFMKKTESVKKNTLKNLYPSKASLKITQKTNTRKNVWNIDENKKEEPEKPEIRLRKVQTLQVSLNRRDQARESKNLTWWTCLKTVPLWQTKKSQKRIKFVQAILRCFLLVPMCYQTNWFSSHNKIKTYQSLIFYYSPKKFSLFWIMSLIIFYNQA